MGFAHNPSTIRTHHPTASTSRLSAPPVINSSTAKPRAKKSRKGKEREVPAEEDVEVAVKKSRSGKRKKKTAKVVDDEELEGARLPDNDEKEYDGETDGAGLGENDDDEDEDGRELGAEGEDEFEGWGEPTPGDWWDPRNLPTNGNERGRSQLRALEMGTYRSALLDTVNGNMDLGLSLLALEELRRKTREEEERVREARGDIPLHKKRRRSTATSSNSGTGNDTDTGDDARLSAHGTTPFEDSESDDPTRPSYPYPTSSYLAKFTHWPIHPSQLPTGPDQVSFPEAIATTFAATSRRTAPTTRPPREPKPRPRSAYSKGGPLHDYPKSPRRSRSRSSSDSSRSPSPARSTTSSIASTASLDSDDDSDALDSSLDEPASGPFESTSLGIIDAVLDRVVQAVELGPFPPVDYWDEIARKAAEKAAEYERRKRRKRDGKSEEGGSEGDEVIGWEVVLQAVREMKNVKTGVADLLQQRLEGIYGPPREPVLKLPPLKPNPALPPPTLDLTLHKPTRPRRQPRTLSKPNSPTASRRSRRTSSNLVSRSPSRSVSTPIPEVPDEEEEVVEEEEVEEELFDSAPRRPRKRKAGEEIPRKGKGKGKAARTQSTSFEPPSPGPPNDPPLPTPPSSNPFSLFLLPPLPEDLPPLPPDYEPMVFDPVLVHLMSTTEGEKGWKDLEVPIDPALL